MANHMRPELPYLAAGAISVAGGVRLHGGWPPNLTRTVIGTVVLVIIASATTNTKLAPLVSAFGMLVALVAAMAAIRANTVKTGEPVGKAAGTAVKSIANTIRQGKK